MYVLSLKVQNELAFFKCLCWENVLYLQPEYDKHTIMLLNLTEEQISQLAPDAASVKAGKGLVSRTKWVLLEYSDRAIWGHCQGSGKTPYQTVVDIKNIAFKCSCPSRKFPCKHSLGLLYMYVSYSESFRQAEEPDWVAAWLSKREEKAVKQEQKEKKTAAPVDEAAQAKRQAVRHQKVLGGIEDLQIWMKDLLRNGLLNVPERVSTLFETISRRMVDAQAQGLAGRLKGLQHLDYYSEDWKYELTDKLAKIYLLSESYKNLESLSADWQAEIRTQIGYPQSKEEVMAGEPVTDQWLVLHMRSNKVNDIKTETFWLYGKSTHRMAVYLNFIAPGTLQEFKLLTGATYQGQLYFYQGINALRALPKELQRLEENFSPSFCSGLQAAANAYRTIVRTNPFAEEVPVLVENVRLVTNGNQHYLQDAEGFGIPVHIEETIRIDILAVTGGKPFSAFLLADAVCWDLKTIWYQSEFYFWKDEIN